jgi:hypothetical protein
LWELVCFAVASYQRVYTLCYYLQGVPRDVKKKFIPAQDANIKQPFFFSDTQVYKETLFYIWVSTGKLTLYLLSINRNIVFVS